MNEVKATLRRVEEKLDMLIGMRTGLQPPAGGGVPAVPTDPYFADVVTLLHLDDNLTEVTGKAAWTTNTGYTTDAAFGTHALSLVGGNVRMSSGDTDLDLGADKQTIEFFLKQPSAAQSDYLFASANSWAWSSTGIQFFSSISANGALNFNFFDGSGPTSLSSAAGAVNPTTYTHVAFVYDPDATNKWSIFAAGNLVLSSTTSMVALSTWGRFDFGTPIFVGGSINALVDDVRITKGVARYSANFTPPTAAFPDA